MVSRTQDALPVLIGGQWRKSYATGVIERHDGDSTHLYPVSSWTDVEEALAAATACAPTLQELGPDAWAALLEAFAALIESESEALAAVAQSETALAFSPRLLDVEIPRTTDQLRQAAAAARTRSWTLPTISPAERIASYLAPLPGVAAIFGPNNFPFAFNSVAGGDFAAAIATGHPVIAKANPGHLQTTMHLAELAHRAGEDVGAPASTIQLIHHIEPEVGTRLVADSRVAATAFTGSRAGGMALKAAADAAGRPIYLEMSSSNPVILLEGALQERGTEIATELVKSVLAGAGQFCTSPGLIVIPASASGDSFLSLFSNQLVSEPSEELLDERVTQGLIETREVWQEAGAITCSRSPFDPEPRRFPNTVMAVNQSSFLQNAEALQKEAFGNMSLVVQVNDVGAVREVVASLEGNLTGSIYSAIDGSEDENYRSIASVLRPKVGRLLNDKVPTGVAVVPSMNHGGPYPATGHPHFTAVGIPASLRRFGMLQSFDNVRVDRLPPELHPENPLDIQRLVDGEWTRATTGWG